MSDNSDPETSLLLRNVLKFTVLAETLCWLLVFAIEIYAMVEYFVWGIGMKPSTQKKDLRNDKLIKLHQIGITFFNLFTAGFILSFVMAPPGSISESLCRSLGTMPAVGYCFSVQILYSFFLIKVDLVSGFERAQWYNRLLFLIRIVVYVFVPLVLLPLAVVTFYGYVDETTGYCHQVTREITTNTVFLVGHIIISTSLVILFVEPLRQNELVLERGGSGMKDSVLKIVRRNMILTSVAIFSSTIMSLVYLIIILVDSNKDKIYLYDVSLVLAYTDLSINGICAKLMTSKWLPMKLRHMLGCTRPNVDLARPGNPNIKNNQQEQSTAVNNQVTSRSGNTSMDPSSFNYMSRSHDLPPLEDDQIVIQ